IGLAFIADQLTASRVREGERAGEAAVSPGRRGCERGEWLLVRIEKTEKRMLCFVDKIEIRLLGLEKKRKQLAMKSDAGCK
ncbi:hypothetical protein BHE74_00053283, partial [Ensete ventricosum]